jgi:hypothetical protein
MLRDLQKQLAPVRSRLNLRRACAGLAGGLVIGGWIALMAGMMALFSGSALASIIALAAAVAVPLGLAALPLLRGATWSEAARAVDRRFQLHNRTSTALYLAEHPTGDAFDSLQLEDAAAQLRGKNLRDAVALRISWQRLASGLLLTVLGLGLVAWSTFMPKSGPIRVAPAVRGGPRQEVLDRKAASLPAINDALALASVQLLSTPDAGSAMDSSPQIGVDVAERYFDQRQVIAANAPR